jgi:hypothetical protein
MYIYQNETGPVLVRVVKHGTYSGGKRVYIGNPVRVANDETEGADFISEVDGASEIAVTILGSTAPLVGDFVIGYPVAPGYAGRVSGAAPSKICIFPRDPCAVPYNPYSSDNTFGGYLPPIPGMSLQLQSGSDAAGWQNVEGSSCITNGSVTGAFTSFDWSALGGDGYTSIPRITVTGSSTGNDAVLSGVMRIGTKQYDIGPSQYQMNDLLKVDGGKYKVQGLYLVIGKSLTYTLLSLTSVGQYQELPPNPITLSGGHGSGASFPVTFDLIGPDVISPGKDYLSRPLATVLDPPPLQASKGFNHLVTPLWDAGCCIDVPGPGTYRIIGTRPKRKDLIYKFISTTTPLVSNSVNMFLAPGNHCCGECPPLPETLMGTTSLGSFPMTWHQDAQGWSGVQPTPADVAVFTNDADTSCWDTVKSLVNIYYFFQCSGYDRNTKQNFYVAWFVVYYAQCCIMSGVNHTHVYPGNRLWPSDIVIPAGGLGSISLAVPGESTDVGDIPMKNKNTNLGLSGNGCLDPLAARFTFTGRTLVRGSYCGQVESAPVPGDLLVTEQ